MDEDIAAVGTDVRRSVTRLYARFRAERADGEVGDAALLVLIVLDKQDGLSLSELAGIAQVTLASMSQTVRRLEKLGHLTMVRDTADRRRTLFSLTTRGRHAATISRRHRQEWLNARLAGLTPEELADVARGAAILLRIAES